MARRPGSRRARHANDAGSGLGAAQSGRGARQSPDRGRVDPFRQGARANFRPATSPSMRWPSRSCRTPPRRRAFSWRSATRSARSRCCASTSGVCRGRCRPLGSCCSISTTPPATGRNSANAAEDFHVHFNVADAAVGRLRHRRIARPAGSRAFPHVQKQVVELWRKPGCRAYLERLLYDNREGRRNGFPLSTYARHPAAAAGAGRAGGRRHRPWISAKAGTAPKPPAQRARRAARGRGGRCLPTPRRRGPRSSRSASTSTRRAPRASRSRSGCAAAELSARARPFRAGSRDAPSRPLSGRASPSRSSCRPRGSAAPADGGSPRPSCGRDRRWARRRRSASGSPISARAIATRCCWPPESSFG